MTYKLRVSELFAGVGGFRLGLEGWKGKSSTSRYTKDHPGGFEVVWSNQWEPSTKTQHASMIYTERWGEENHSNVDINSVEISSIPEHDVLVGGFPCQDYSVATLLKNSKGLLGKKGVLWWAIHKILSEVQNKPKYLILENVDRILTSPNTQKGRDFAIILKSLSELGYIVEWKTFNAADYGMPQKRKRTFIMAYHSTSPFTEKIKSIGEENWLFTEGVIARAFKNAGKGTISCFDLESDIIEISKNFNKNTKNKPFSNHGMIINDTITTIDIKPDYQGPRSTISSIMEQGNISDEYRLNLEELEKWRFLKGGKSKIRKTADGFEYNWAEGAMSFPDPIDKPSRTIITSEGGKAPSRIKHVIDDGVGLRRLTPIELERLNMFPDNFTQMEKISDSKRAFLMGNALVVGVVEKIGLSLVEMIKQEEKWN